MKLKTKSFLNKMNLYYSLANISNLLVNYISHHPLIIEAPVIHYRTKKRVKISSYRQGFGIPTNCGLICSIYPAFSTSLRPTTTNTSVFIPDNEKEFVHYIIHFYWSEANFDQCTPCYTEAPVSANICTDDIINNLPADRTSLSSKLLGVASQETEKIDYYINPGFMVIADYLEIIRLIFNDQDHLYKYSGFLSEIQLLSLNYLTSEWNDETNAYWHQGQAFIRMTTAMQKDWKQDCGIYPEFTLDPRFLNVEINNCDLENLKIEESN